MRISDWSSDVCSSDLFATVVLSAGEGNTHYFDAKEASLDFAKALRGALLLVQDYKLGRPLGAAPDAERATRAESRSEEHTSELQSLMRISYAVFCLKKKKKK